MLVKERIRQIVWLLRTTDWTPARWKQLEYISLILENMRPAPNLRA